MCGARMLAGEHETTTDDGVGDRRAYRRRCADR
jgi:hypothetical protein